MKKYRLLKDLPQAKAGTIWTKAKAFNEYCSNFLMKGDSLLPERVENNPEWFELVVDKMYEVLSFKCLKTKDLFKLNGGYYIKNNYILGPDFESMMRNPPCVSDGSFSIHSIKRLSDGVIFTIGDFFVREKVCGDTSVYKIDSFKEMAGGHFNAICDRANGGSFSMSRIEIADEVIKPPLGLTPQMVHRELRLKEINEAISRYGEAKLKVPSDWLCEKSNLEFLLNNTNVNGKLDKTPYEQKKSWWGIAIDRGRESMFANNKESDDWWKSFMESVEEHERLYPKVFVSTPKCECKSWTKMGVGSGNGNLFVHGDYDSIKALQGIVLENESLRSERSALHRRIRNLLDLI